MGCFLVAVALMLPRLAMVLILLLTNWYRIVFPNWLVPLFGFVFLPYTTLAYMGAILTTGGVPPVWLVIIIVAAVVDLGHWSGGYHTHRRRRRPATRV